MTMTMTYYEIALGKSRMGTNRGGISVAFTIKGIDLFYISLANKSVM